MISAESEIQVDTPEVRVTGGGWRRAAPPDITFTRWIM
jgi:hypothetical protein